MVLGLDAADLELLRLWSADGTLPVFQSLFDRGMWGELKTITEISHTAVWPSIITGTNPGRHGIYNIYQALPNRYKIFRVGAQNCVHPPVWKQLDAGGRACIVIDSPFDELIDDFQGIQITEWGSWVRYTKRRGQPAALWNRLIKKIGIPPIANEATVPWMERDELRRLRDGLVDGIKKKVEAVKWLIDSQPWEFFFIFFPEIHPAGHFFWHLHDAQYDLFSAQDTPKPGNYLQAIYRNVDSAIGQIVSRLRAQDILLIVSGDRIGPSYSAWHLLPETLARMGLMASRSRHFQTASGGGVSNRNDFWKQLRDKVPAHLRKKITQILPRTVSFKLWQRWTGPDLDWPRTKVFYVPNDCQGHIRINLKGREPFGCVAPGREYNELCSTIKDRFEELVNPQNGRRAVKAVIRTDQFFTGNRAASLPDLVVVWDENAQLTNELFSRRIGSVKSRRAAYDLPPYYVGNHQGPGFALWCGADIGTGRLSRESHIYDMAPTILSLFNLSSPVALDGTVSKEIIGTV